VPHVELPGGHLGYRVVDTARLRPRLEDLAIESPAQLPAALRSWHNAALRQWATEGWLSVESIGPLLSRLDAVQQRLRDRGRTLSLAEVWKLVNAPVDEDNAELLATLALALAGDRAQRPVLSWLLETGRLRDASLEDAEQAARTASILRWFALQYPGVGGVTIELAAALEQAAAQRVTARLAAEVRSPSVGRCRSCGRSCAPWFALCERCYAPGRR
jgi:ATP-dependent RNA helicase SUPV3L1/SUV3